MRLCIFYCLLLASIAAASPNGRHKRDLAYLKNLIKSAIFGRSKINIQPQTNIREENGYKVFRLPGYDDIMIKVSPKKPVLEEFVYPAKLEKVNLNAFGSVVGTKTKNDTLGAVKEVNKLLSTGILYGGHNNVMKETVVPMFPALNTRNYVVKEKIQTAPVIEARPVFKEIIENKPVLKERIETRPVLTEVIESRPILKETIEARPVLTEVIESRPVLKERIETRPVLTEVIESRPVFKERIEARPVLTEIIESRPVLKERIETRPVVTEVIEEVIETKPVLKEVIKPLEERLELKVPFEPTYTYKQMQNNEAVMTYTAHTNPGVEVLETLKMKTELPMCIKKRVDEAIVLGADPNRFAAGQEVFHYQSQPVVDFSYPRIEANSFVQSVDQYQFAPVQEVFQYESQPVLEFSYPRVEGNSFIQTADQSWSAPVQEFHQYKSAPFMDFLYPRVETNPFIQNAFREEVFAEGFETVAEFGLAPQKFGTQKDNPVRYNLGPRKTQPINPRPVPLHSHKSLHFEADISASKEKVNSKTKNVQAFNNLGEKVDIAQTLGPIPSQYITHVANKTGNVANEKIKQVNAVPITASKDSVANAKIPVNVYKSQSNPNTGKVVKEPQPLRTNVETSFNEYIATHVLAARKDKAQAKNVVFTNKVTGKPPNVDRPLIVATNIQPEKEKVQTSDKSAPVVVKDNKSYSYQQKHADGSTLNMNGNKDGVAVKVKENNRGRGDIPDQ